MSIDEPTIVARTFSRGGTCDGCGRRIRAGEEIVKLDIGARGRQTSGGNGQGIWVGLGCCLIGQPGE